MKKNKEWFIEEKKNKIKFFKKIGIYEDIRSWLILFLTISLILLLNGHFSGNLYLTMFDCVVIFSVYIISIILIIACSIIIKILDTSD